ncbi:retrograde regulation protein 2 [Tricladium varicosporioides]|nr:retrograde regulation protein 2 [Hymenoscyphus varicosporioides]
MSHQPSADSKMQVENIEDVEKWEERSSIQVEAPVAANLQKRIRRQFDKRVLPIVCCLYVLSYLDRGNIGNAKTAGAQKALHLDSSQWTWVLNSFYICYVVFEWTTLLWKIFPAHIYVAALCVLWGSAAMCSGFVKNMAGLIVCRSLLGIFEAGFGAGAPYFLSLFYQRRELGLRVSLLLGMSPLANCFASALAYGITHIKSSWGSWRYLFIIEGIPTIIFAPIVFFLLADSPGTARFLSEEDKTLAVERLQARDTTAKNKVHWKQFFAGLTDYQNYVHTAIHFCCNYSFAGLSNFLPTIVEDMGYTSINAQGLTAPPYFASFLLCALVAFASDRYGKRGYVVAGFATMGMIGYLLLVLVKDLENTGPRYLGIWLATCGIFPALAINITWLLNNQGGDSKRGAGLAILAIVGQCSSFVSSAVFPKSAAPFYTVGCSLGAGLTGAIVVLALGLHFKLEAENKRRDRVYGAVDPDEHVDVSALGDGNTKFRYLT